VVEKTSTSREQPPRSCACNTVETRSVRVPVRTTRSFEAAVARFGKEHHQRLHTRKT